MADVIIIYLTTVTFAQGCIGAPRGLSLGHADATAPYASSRPLRPSAASAGSEGPSHSLPRQRGHLPGPPDCAPPALVGALSLEGGQPLPIPPQAVKQAALCQGRASAPLSVPVDASAQARAARQSVEVGYGARALRSRRARRCNAKGMGG